MSQKPQEAKNKEESPWLGSHLKECPPQEVISKEQTYFRVLLDGDLKKENFVPRVNLPPKGRYEDACGNWAVSLYPTEGDAKNWIDSIPVFRNGGIVSVEIKKDHRRVHDNKLTHSNGWHKEKFDSVVISKKG